MNASAAIAVLAREAARKAVKRQLQAQGIKLARFTGREISRMAEAYLDDHPELIAEAAETVRKSPHFRTLVQREERRRKGNQQ